MIIERPSLLVEDVIGIWSTSSALVTEELVVISRRPPRAPPSWATGTAAEEDISVMANRIVSFELPIVMVFFLVTRTILSISMMYDID